MFKRSMIILLFILHTISVFAQVRTEKGQALISPVFFLLAIVMVLVTVLAYFKWKSRNQKGPGK